MSRFGNFIKIVGGAAVLGFAFFPGGPSSPVFAQCCGIVSPAQNYQVEYATVHKPVVLNTYKKEYRTEYQDEEIITYKTVWDTVEQKTTVAKQVPETSYVKETYKVLKPSWETEYRDESYNITRYVEETSFREEKVVVAKPVVEVQNREIVETVKKPVQRTYMQEKRYTVQRPETIFESRTVDRGGYVDSLETVPGKAYSRLTWKRGGTYLDPATGVSQRRLPGFYWTQLHSDPTYKVEKVYKPSWITEQVPVTTYKPETVVEQVPVNITTYEEEKIVRIEPVQVHKMEREEVVKQIPVKTMKPVLQRVEKIVPVQVCRMEEQEVVREVPRTTYKTVLEEQVRYVKVPRRVKEVQIVRKPVRVEQWVPISTTINSSSTISRRLPANESMESYGDGKILRPREDPGGDDSSTPSTFKDGEKYNAEKPEVIRTDDLAIPPLNEKNLGTGKEDSENST